MAAWVTWEHPPGAGCLPLSVNDTIHNLGKVLARAQSGGCVEVRDLVRKRSCHIHGVCPPEVEPVADLLPGIIARTRSGRLVEREVIYA